MQRSVTAVDGNHRGGFRGHTAGFLGQSLEAGRRRHAAIFPQDLGEALGTAGILSVGAGTRIDEDYHCHEGGTLHDKLGPSICIDTASTTAITSN